MAAPQIDPKTFAEHVGGWTRTSGPDPDVVLSCRTRLARNVAGHPFVGRLEPGEARSLCQELSGLFGSEHLGKEMRWVEMDAAPQLLRLLLRERHLVSRDLAPSDDRLASRPGRAVAFSAEETLSVMINEEDHLRLQGLASGFALREAWERVRDLDRALEEDLTFAFSDELGYLTGCPTNVGTGLRASVMLHLPALGLVRSELEKVLTAAHRTGLAVRGMYGEGSRAAGDLYQISNQTTLGCTEEDLLASLEELVPCIVEFERKVRGVLFEEQRSTVEDRVRRSLGHLRTDRSLATDVALLHLSNVRLGVNLGLLDGLETAELNRLTIQVQKAHVQALMGDPEAGLAEPTERDRMRASFLRRRFAAFSG